MNKQEEEKGHMQVPDIKNISVIGAGTMGHGIGLAYAWAGYQVILHDISGVILNNAMSRIRDALKMMADEGLISVNDIEDILSRITTTTDLKKAVEYADFVTEAVTENIEIKRKLFSELDTLCLPQTVLASNTSSLILHDFSSQILRKDKVIITHWVNPPHLVPVVEVIGCEETSNETIELACLLLRNINKVPVRIQKEIPGLIINRIHFAILREAWSLWQQGIASPEDIDTVIKGSLGFRWAVIGPLAASDLGGLDLFCIVANHLFGVISDMKKPPQQLIEMVKAGKLGLKSGEGFYSYKKTYSDEGQDKSVEERDRKHIQLLKLWYS